MWRMEKYTIYLTWILFRCFLLFIWGAQLRLCPAFPCALFLKPGVREVGSRASAVAAAVCVRSALSQSPSEEICSSITLSRSVQISSHGYSTCALVKKHQVLWSASHAWLPGFCWRRHAAHTAPVVNLLWILRAWDFKGRRWSLFYKQGMIIMWDDLSKLAFLCFSWHALPRLQITGWCTDGRIKWYRWGHCTELYTWRYV